MSEYPQTPEAVAYRLMTDVLTREKGWEHGREHILSCYVECLKSKRHL